MGKLDKYFAIINNSEWGKYYGPDLLKFLDWDDLPKTLKDLDRYDPKDKDPFEVPGDDGTRHITEMLTEAGIATRTLPYHNIENFQRAYWEGRQAIDEVERLAKTEFPEAVKLAASLAIASHDFYHTGSTYLREDEKSPDYRTVEGRSALIVDQKLKEKGYSPLFRAFVAHIIWASSFGKNAVEPEGFFGRLMRAVDVNLPDDFARFIYESMAVWYGEIPAGPRPKTLEEFIKNRENFLKYVEATNKDLNEAAKNHVASLFSEEDRKKLQEGLKQKSLTERLGWDSRLEKMREAMEKAKDPNSSEGNILRSSWEYWTSRATKGNEENDRGDRGESA